MDSQKAQKNNLYGKNKEKVGLLRRRTSAIKSEKRIIEHYWKDDQKVDVKGNAAKLAYDNSLENQN